MKLFLGIILGLLAALGVRRAWNAFQLRELERMAGLSRPKEFNCQPGKWGKRFKYLHNFLVETWLHLTTQLLYLKKDLLKLGLKHNVLGFKSTPLGKCLQAAIDAETAVFGEGNSLVLFHNSFLLEFKDYLYSLAHPDPVIYGIKGFREKKRAAGRVNLDHGGN